MQELAGDDGNMLEEEPQIYGGFARVYDLFMDDIPYDECLGICKGFLRSMG